MSDGVLDEVELYALWLDASRRVGQSQCTYPQPDTLRAFAHTIWMAGFGAGQSDEQVVECPYG